MRIEICGGIGAGKTTLATLLGSNGYSSVLENFKINPFWIPFYSNPNKFNFETEITFLLQHYHDIKVAKENQLKIACDFSLYQDLAYAKMGLQNNRLKIFEDVFNDGLNELGQPDLLICLQCDPATLLHRIQARGRKEEDLINTEFLTVLNDDIYLEAEKLGHSKQVLFIDSKRYNFAYNENDKAAIVNLINSTIQQFNIV